MTKSTSICTCSLDGAFGLGAATGGSPIVLGGELVAGKGTLGVSGAKVVAGEDAIDDGNPGKVVGKSEMSKTGTTAGPLGTTYFAIGGGALVNATGPLLSTAFRLVVGGDFNIGRLLNSTGGGAFWLTPADPKAAPVVLVSSSSSITMGPTSAMVASEEVAGPETGRGRSKGEALKILPTFLT